MYMERRLYSASESESTNSFSRKSEDKKFFDSLIDCIGAGPVNIDNIGHLGAI